MFKKLIFLLAILLGGCANSIQETIYLQNATVNGPLIHPPIFVTDDHNGVKVSPWFSFNNHSSIMGRAQNGGNNYYTIDSNYTPNTGDNVKWNLPKVRAGVDFNFPLGRTVSFFCSFGYASQNSYQLTGGALGLGFHSVNKGGAIRLNFGCLIQQYQYDATTVVVQTVDPVFGKQYTNVIYYHDIDKNTNFNYFGNLTYNTVSTDMPINFFFSLAFFTQTLLNFQPEQTDTHYDPFGGTRTTTDTRGEASTIFLSFSPGVYMNFSPMMRFLIGVSIAKDLGDFMSGSGSVSSTLFVMPMVKVEISF
jgi:hypothetical protein